MMEDSNDVPKRRVLALLGCWLLLGPLIGMIGTIVGMLRAFSTLKTAGTPDPTVLAGDISIALLTTLYGLIYGLVGVLLVSLALYRNLNRERWFYRTVITLSFMWCFLLFPLGLIAGIYLIVAFRRRKAEFA